MEKLEYVNTHRTHRHLSISVETNSTQPEYRVGLFVIERKINQKRDRVIPPGDIALRNDPYYITKSVHNLQNIGDFRKIRKSRPTERS